MLSIGRSVSHELGVRSTIGRFDSPAWFYWYRDWYFLLQITQIPKCLIKIYCIWQEYIIVWRNWNSIFADTQSRPLCLFYGTKFPELFSCDQAALWMVFSVRLSVCPFVRLSHLFDYVPIIVSSWNFQELSHWTRVRSMQKVKVRGQRSRSQRSRPKFSFPDFNSSLNSHMMMKWYI